MVSKSVQEQLKKIPDEIKAATTKESASPSPEKSETPEPEESPPAP
jgi:hypothetical protein